MHVYLAKLTSSWVLMLLSSGVRLAMVSFITSSSYLFFTLRTWFKFIFD